MSVWTENSKWILKSCNVNYYDMVLTADRGDETVDGILFASCKVDKNIIFMKCLLLLLFLNLKWV